MHIKKAACTKNNCIQRRVHIAYSL